MTLPVIHSDDRDCTACELHEHVRNPGIGFRHITTSLPPGEHTPCVVFLGQNPGALEDARGEPFVGPSGVRLRRAYVEGIRLPARATVYVGNIVRCHTQSNAKPLARHAKPCSAHTVRDLLAILHTHLDAPTVVVLVGGPACEYFYRYVLGLPKITLNQHFRDQGNPIELVEGLLLTTFATYHPAGVMRNPNLRHAVHDHMQLVSDFLDGTLAAPSEPTIIPLTRAPTDATTQRRINNPQAEDGDRGVAPRELDQDPGRDLDQD